TPDMSQVIKEQASMDFQFGRKPTEPIILIESAEKDGREEEVTPDKIKAKALKSAEEWVKNSPFIGPPPSRVLSRREPTHSSTATKNEEKVLEEEEEGDMDSMIKAAAQKDFDSHKSVSEVRSDFSFNALSEDAAAPFKFSKQHQEDSEDSDILDDDEDAKEVSDSEEDAKEASGSEKDEEDMEVEEAPSSQRDPKFNFSHPISVEREEEDVLFSFSKGQSIESIKSDDEETNELKTFSFPLPENYLL
ncbi:AT hook containing transcription factor 1, partial [Caligus rogercresseyi]